MSKNHIDKTGYMECETFSITENVYLTQKDIRSFQLAKSAVCAAIKTLMHLAGIDANDIETLYVSGGFSAKINVDNAVKVGLFPKELKEKYRAVYNSSLLGTIKYACQPTDLTLHSQNATYIDLSCNTMFSQWFVDHMMF